MRIFTLFCLVLTVLTVIVTHEVDGGYHHKKKLKIKHVWKKGGYGKKGYGHGKKIVGYSKRYQHMKHKGKGHY